MKSTGGMAEKTRVDAKVLIDRFIARDAIEIVDAATGWRLVHELLDSAPDDDDRMLVFARGANDMAPLVMVIRLDRLDDLDSADPYWELGGGD